jgi:putative transcriptional regulator
MPVRITLDAVLAERRMTAKALAEEVGLSETQLSMFRSGKVKGLRFSTLSKMCWVLKCQPADLFCYDENATDMSGADDKD